MSNLKNEDIANDLAKKSQVNESANKRVMSKTARISVLLVIILMIGFAYLTSKGHSRNKETAQPSKNPDNPYTLQENLSVIERMQREAAEKKVHVANYTSTPDGQKIGNPKTFRTGSTPKQEIDPELATRMNAPTTFINVNNPAMNKVRKNPELAAPLIAGNDSNSAFLNAKNSVEMVNAVALPHPEYTVAAGEFIAATMETAESSELPGIVRAVVARNVYGITGDRILIPKGARLFGQYSSGNTAPAQTRFLISWTRVQLPNGVVVTLNSPSADGLGRGGLGADAVDRHFTERFSTGFLFSILGTTTATLGVNPMDEYNSLSQYRMNVANSMEQSARDSLQQNRNIQNTLYKNQGAEIQVTVARDLDFYQVARIGK
jgi:type IV secretion system protein VirB10